jgi:hypothetical protein
VKTVTLLASAFAIAFVAPSHAADKINSKKLEPQPRSLFNVQPEIIHCRKYCQYTLRTYRWDCEAPATCNINCYSHPVEKYCTVR